MSEITKLFKAKYVEATRGLGEREYHKMVYIEASEQDLRELGWVRAVPTDCGECIHWERTDGRKLKTCTNPLHFPCGVQTWKSRRSVDGSWIDFYSHRNEVCLDFVARPAPSSDGVSDKRVGKK